MKPVYLEHTDIHATLTTWLYCHFWMMWSAENLGFDAYINWPEGNRSLFAYQDRQKFAQEPNMYKWYFVQPKIQGVPRTHVPLSHTWTWGEWKDPMPSPLMAQPLSVIRDYFKKNLIFNDVVKARGKELADKYDIDFRKTIGVTWRGTDVVLDGRPIMPIEIYFPFIDDILENEPDLRIVCTAEETGILDPLLKRYNAVAIEEFESSPRGSRDNPERHSAKSGFERGLQPALMVWLFSKCAHYIKNRSSTGAVASWISDGRIVSLGHPETLGFPANTDTAEIEGKLYPLYDYGKR